MGGRQQDFGTVHAQAAQAIRRPGNVGVTTAVSSGAVSMDDGW